MLKPLSKTIPTAIRQAFGAGPMEDTRMLRLQAVRAAGLTLALAIGTPALAIGLGDVRVQSALGQPLRASLALLGGDAAARQLSCFSARLSSADGAFIVSPRIALGGAGAGNTLSLSSTLPIGEPALTLQVEIGCGDLVRKEFSLLLDPPMNAPSVPLIASARSDAAAAPAAVRRADIGARADAEPADATAGAPRRAPTAPSVRRHANKTTTPGIAAAPGVAPTLAPGAAAVAAPLAKPHVLAAPSKNVLRLSAHDKQDLDVIDAISLRLALADRLAAPAAQAEAAPIPDLAKSAARRAAQARFAAVLRDDPDVENAPQAATEQQLQKLQAKMQMLEAETAKLKQANRTATTATPAEPADNHWLLILSALLALALAALAWLSWRMRALKRSSQDWRWDEGDEARNAASQRTAPEEWQPPPPVTAMADEVILPAAYSIDAVAQALRTGATPTQRVATPVAAPAAAVAPPASRQITTPASAAAPATQQAAPTPVMQQASEQFVPDTAAFEPAEPAPIVPPLEFMLDAPLLPPAGPTESKTGIAAMAPAPMPKPAAPGAGKLDLDDLQFAEIRLQHPAVEEISDVMQEAEFWISLRDSQRAIEVLEPYATFEQPNSPLPWLYLFDLYVELGLREKYDVLHERFQRVFNARIPTWNEQKLTAETPASESTIAERGILDLPHIAEHITELWQGTEIVPYLESLLIDDRNGNRSGFDLSVYREIMFLIALAYEVQQSASFDKPAGAPGWTLAA